MRGVRALPSPRPHQPRLGKPIHHHREQPVSTITFGQTVPERAEHPVIEPGLGQLHPQRVLPVDATCHRPSRLPISQILRVLQHRHQRQPGRRHPTPSICRNQSTKSSSTNRSCNRSRITIAGVPLGLAAHATRAVSTGTAEPEPRPIDIRNPSTATPSAPAATRPPIKHSKIANSITKVGQIQN
jgi:hypothetical protein